MTVTIYGASDDLIEIEGDIREEWSPPEDGPALLAFSDGTVLRIEFERDGTWRIAQIKQGSAEYTHVPSVGDDDYSDRVTLSGDIGGTIAWVVLGTNITSSKASARW